MSETPVSNAAGVPAPFDQARADRAQAVYQALSTFAGKECAVDELLQRAGAIYAFIDGGAAAAKAPRKPRSSGASAASTESAATPSAQAPVTEAAAVTATSPSSGGDLDFLDTKPPVAEEKKPEPEKTLDDVRAALVNCQTKKGKDAAMKALAEKGGGAQTLGALKKEHYAAVIAEANAKAEAK